MQESTALESTQHYIPSKLGKCIQNTHIRRKQHTLLYALIFFLPQEYLLTTFAAPLFSVFRGMVEILHTQHFHLQTPARIQNPYSSNLFNKHHLLTLLTIFVFQGYKDFRNIFFYIGRNTYLSCHSLYRQDTQDACAVLLRGVTSCASFRHPCNQVGPFTQDRFSRLCQCRNSESLLFLLRHAQFSANIALKRHHMDIIPASNSSFNACMCKICHRHAENTYIR